jgi:aminoglycoside phosphotransferase (APT) family kinase protein
VCPLEVRDDRTLVHGDFNGANILLRRGGGDTRWEVAAVLDWEFAMAGTSLFDVANMLRHYKLRFGVGFERPFIGGFQAAGGTLPPRWREIARLLDFMSLVELLSRLDAGPTMVRDVLAVVDAYLTG